MIDLYKNFFVLSYVQGTLPSKSNILREINKTDIENKNADIFPNIYIYIY